MILIKHLIPVVSLLKSSKFIGIIVGLLILVVLSSGCISVGGSSQSLSDNSNNLTNVSAVNGTYSVGNVSFKCPENWSVVTGNDGMILASPGNPTDAFSFISFAPQFQVQIIPNSDFSGYSNLPADSSNNSGGIMIGGSVNGESMSDIINTNSSIYNGISVNSSPSEQEIAEIMQNSVDPSWNEISNSTVTVDSKKAYETTYMVNSLIPPVIDRKLEQIIFVKNGNTYLLLLQAQNWDFDKEKQNFDVILSGFKVQ